MFLRSDMLLTFYCLITASDTRRGRAPKILIMAPTRELAKQVRKNCAALMGASPIDIFCQVAAEFESLNTSLEIQTVYGGGGGASIQRQRDAMRKGLDVIVGTPGRIIDHLENGNLNLSEVVHVVSHVKSSFFIGIEMTWESYRSLMRLTKCLTWVSPRTLTAFLRKFQP